MSLKNKFKDCTKIVSFGCSLVFGDELKDCNTNRVPRIYSKKTFPALIAEHCNKEYECQAISGGSNDRIERLLNDYLMTNENEKIGVVIGWTALQRREYNKDGEYFVLQPDKKEKLHPVLSKAHKTIVESYFFDDLLQELYQKIYRTQNMLQNLDIPYVMVNMMQWNEQRKNFEVLDLVDLYHQSFLAWAYTHKYPTGKLLHPLEEAHLDFFNKLVEYYDTNETIC